MRHSNAPPPGRGGAADIAQPYVAERVHATDYRVRGGAARRRGVVHDTGCGSDGMAFGDRTQPSEAPRDTGPNGPLGTPAQPLPLSTWIVTGYLIAGVIAGGVAWVNGGWESGVAAVLASFLCVAGGMGLRGGLAWRDQPHGVAVAALGTGLVVFVLYSLAPLFTTNLAGAAVPGWVWCSGGLLLGWSIPRARPPASRADKPAAALPGWIEGQPHGRELRMRDNDLLADLERYRRMARELFVPGTAEAPPPYALVSIKPLLVTLASTELRTSRPLTAGYTGHCSYDYPDPLDYLGVEQTPQGALAALFVRGELPALSAWGPASFERDHVLVTTENDLDRALEALGQVDASLLVPHGVRLRREGDTLIARCLIFSPTRGLADLTVRIDANGGAVETQRDVLVPAPRVMPEDLDQGGTAMAPAAARRQKVTPGVVGRQW